MEIVLLVGRILFGAFFIMMGLNHFQNLAMMSGYAQSKNVPFARLAVIVTGVMLVAGGASVLLGIVPIVGLTVLILFLLSTLVTMHDFWNMKDPQQRIAEQVNFLKNVALIGATLALMYGASGWALALYA
ncbi:MAG: DoxX family protein [Rubrobacteraceae bacterium]|jgi:putative oxidoreductase|nr:DoxX family protein [Rubrobacteraceae bacterium]MDQ5811197.1 DoxX family protein [Actinomycetota bacterium]